MGIIAPSYLPKSQKIKNIECSNLNRIEPSREKDIFEQHLLDLVSESKTNELAIVLDPSIAKKSPILSDSLKSSNAEFVLKDQDFEGKITERLISDVSTKIDSRYKAESVLDSNKLISKRKFTQVVGFSDREENMSKTIRDEMISKDSIFSSNEYEKNLIERKENNRNIKPKIEKLDDA